MSGVLVGLSGCGAQDEAKLLASAKAKLAQNDFAGAVIDAKNLLQVKPDSPEGRLLLGRALLARSDAAGAEEALRRALEFGQAEKDVLPVLAQALNAQNKTAVVLQMFGKTQLDDRQASAALSTEIANSHLVMNEPDEAEVRVKAALVADPAFGPALLMRARAFAARGDAQGALRLVEQVLGKNPSDAGAWLVKGDLMAMSPSGTAAAQEAYQKAVKLQPGLPAPHAGLVLMRLRQRDLSGARTEVAAMNKALPGHPTALFFDAQVSYLSNDFERARELTQQLLRGGGTNPNLQMLAGMTQMRLGALPQAEALLQAAQTGAPGMPAPRFQLATLYLRMGQTDRALAVVKPLLDAKVNDADLWAVAGQAYAVAGDFKRSDAAFAAAAKLRPADAAIRTELGKALLARGDLQRAVQTLEAAADSDARQVDTDLALLMAHMVRKDYTAATRVAEGLARKQPEWPQAQHLRGTILLAKGDAEGARKAFELALEKDALYAPAITGLADLDLAAGKPAAARERFETLVKKDPRAGGAMLAVAEIIRRSGGGRAEAAEWLDRAVKASPLDVAVWLGAIEHHQRGGDSVAALSRARNAVAAVPNDPDLMLRLAAAQAQEGDAIQAGLTLQQVLKLRPRSAEAHLRLADLDLAAGRLASARNHVTQARQIAPDAVDVERADIVLALAEGQPDKALQVARQRQRRKPGDALGWRLEAEIESSQKHWGAAATAYRKALGVQTRTDTAIGLHAAWVQGGNTADAAAFEKDWLKQHPDDAAFLGHLAKQAQGRGDKAMAEQRYRQALKLQPDSVLLLNNLALVLLDRPEGQSEAVALGLKAVKLAPDMPAALDTLAAAYAAGKSFDKAVEWQGKAVDLAPHQGEYRLELARFLLAAGDKKKARTELQRLEQRGSEFKRQDEVTRLLKQAQA